MVFYIVTKEFSRKNNPILKVDFFRQIATLVLISHIVTKEFSICWLLSASQTVRFARVLVMCIKKEWMVIIFFERRRH